MRAYLKTIITRPAKQAAKVDRLVAYIKELDGTDVTVIEADDSSGDGYPQCATNAFHQSLAAANGQPFIHLESDSIPLRAGWRRDLTDEYRRVGKPILLPDMSSAQEGDIAAGIGVYPGLPWLFPKKISNGAWDLWQLKHLAPIIGRTRLIQHSYQKYFVKPHVPWEFPRDKDFIWPEAVLFHRDPNQTLLGLPPPSDAPIINPNETVLRSSGDMGDVIAALPILRARGGGAIVIFYDPNARPGLCARESMEGARFEAIKPLLEAQPYVSRVEWAGDSILTHAENFRETLRPPNENLTERQARHVDSWPLDMSPWLVAPGWEKHNRIICGRSPRYHNPHGFPWPDVAAAFKDRLLFVGLPAEHAAFEEVVGRKVEHAKTTNLLEVARLIAGAQWCFFNQSCPAWIAIGLGARMVLEVEPDLQNTSVATHPGSFFAVTPSDMRTVQAALQKLK